MSSNSTRPAARRCCRSTAARSPPIAASPRRRSNGSPPYLRGTKAAEGWTAKSPLPGGDLDVSAIAALAAELIRDYPFLTPAHANRLAHAYGTRAAKLLGSARSMADLGQSFGATLTESEVRYLMVSEWARTAEDIVWRRSKLGLRLSAAEIAAIDDWIDTHRIPLEGALLEAGGRT